MVAVGAVVALLGASACGASDAEQVAVVSAQPERPGAPGEVVFRERIAAPEGARAWRIAYHSTGLDGQDVVVTGMVVRPDREPPPGGFPVVAWAHATVGTADRCAPSLAGPQTVTYLDRFLAEGWVVAATDYEGLGTTAPHPYLVGESEGRSVLDIVRAAQELPGSGTSGDAPVALWGFSQGGHAALFAAELAPAYAPELRVAGVAVAAPVSDVASFATRALSRPDQFGVFVSIANGFHHVYRELRIGDVLTPEAVADLALLEQLCIDRVIGAFTRPVDEVRRADPSEVPGWSARLAQNRAGDRPLLVPALVVQGTEDPIVDPATAEALAARYCAQGGVVDLRMRPGEGHNVDAEADLFAWLGDRLALAPPPSTC